MDTTSVALARLTDITLDAITLEAREDTEVATGKNSMAQKVTSTQPSLIFTAHLQYSLILSHIFLM